MADVKEPLVLFLIGMRINTFNSAPVKLHICRKCCDNARGTYSACRRLLWPGNGLA